MKFDFLSSAFPASCTIGFCPGIRAMSNHHRPAYTDVFWPVVQNRWRYSKKGQLVPLSLILFPTDPSSLVSNLSSLLVADHLVDITLLAMALFLVANPPSL